MPYQQYINRLNHGCVVLLIDQSANDSSPSGDLTKVKQRAERIADVANRLLSELAVRCSKSEGVRNYFDIGVIGYGGEPRLALTGPLSQHNLIPVSEIAKHPLRIEERLRKEPDGTGGIIEKPYELPVWLEPVARGSRPMGGALAYTRNILTDWVRNHPDSFPPMVFNIVGGESTDGDPIGPAQELMDLKTNDGNVLILNCYINPSLPLFLRFPASDQGLPDSLSRRLFKMSSILPDIFIEEMRRENTEITYGARLFSINVDLKEVFLSLDIGGEKPSRMQEPERHREVIQENIPDSRRGDKRQGKELIVKARCSIHHADFGAVFVRTADGTWEAHRAFKITSERAAKGYGPDSLAGRISIGAQYAGCPYCGDQSFFLCNGCNTLNCFGAVDQKGKQLKGTCAGCGGMCIIEGQIEKIDGFSDL